MSTQNSNRSSATSCCCTTYVVNSCSKGIRHPNNLKCPKLNSLCKPRHSCITTMKGSQLLPDYSLQYLWVMLCVNDDIIIASVSGTRRTQQHYQYDSALDTPCIRLRTAKCESYKGMMTKQHLRQDKNLCNILKAINHRTVLGLSQTPCRYMQDQSTILEASITYPSYANIGVYKLLAICTNQTQQVHRLA